MATENQNEEHELDFDQVAYVGGEVDDEFDDDLDNADRGDSFDADSTVDDTTDETVPEEETEDGESEEVEEEVEEEAVEEEVEEEAVEEEAEEEVEEAVVEDPHKDRRIPKQRFDEVNERRKAAELRLRELEAKLAEKENTPVEEEFDFDAKEQEYMEAVLDGELDKAKAVRAEIRSAESRKYQEMASTVKEQAVSETQQQQDFMKAVNTLQQEYAQFDPNGKDYDQDLVDEVVEMRDSFLSNPTNVLSPAQALNKAAKYVAAANGLQSASDLAMKDAEHQAAEKEVIEQPDPKKVVARKKTNVKEKVAQAKAQPASMEAGNTDDKGTPNVSEMDDEEFEALPESTKRRLRGDIM